MHAHTSIHKACLSELLEVVDSAQSANTQEQEREGLPHNLGCEAVKLKWLQSTGSTGYHTDSVANELIQLAIGQPCDGLGWDQT